MSEIAIQGRTITFPVHVRAASAWSATFTVPREAAQALVPERLEVATIGSRALLSLAFVRYTDTDLGSYHEFAVSVAVRAHDARPASSGTRAIETLKGNVRAYILHLPVDQTFTLEAGRRIWGYPKRLAQIDIASAGGFVWGTLSENGERSVALGIRNAGTFALPRRSVPTYSDAEGPLNLTSWDMGGPAKGRIGGAVVHLGSGVVADELRSAGLPKRALLTTRVPAVRASFGPPVVVSDAGTLGRTRT